MQLTAQLIEQLAPPEPAGNGKGRQAFYRDSGLIGFAVRVASGGAKSYILERRIRGRVRRITLGRCQHISFDKARKRAIRLIEQIDRENAPRIINGKITDKRISLQAAYAEYLAARPRLSENTIADYQRSLRGPLRDWQATPIKDLTEERILNRHEAYASRSRSRCNNAMRLLSAILNHARLHLISTEHKPIIKNNPVDILSRRGLWYPTRRKTQNTHIQSADLPRWWQATMQLRKTSTREYLQFLLVTGLPQHIAASLRFMDVDFENRQICLNTTRDNGAPFRLPIPKYICRQLHNRLSQHSYTSDYLFPGLSGEKPISDPRMAIKRVKQLSGVDFSLTGLHRTFIQVAGMSDRHQPVLGLISAIRRHKPVMLSRKEIELVAEVQEKIYSLCMLSDGK